MPTVVGIGALVAMLGMTALRLAPGSPGDVITPAAPTMVLPPPAPRPVPSASAPADPTDDPPVRRTSHTPPATTRPPTTDPVTTRPPKSSATPRPAPPPPAVTGSYRVVGTYDAEFIGEVLLSNAAGQAADWTVTVRFPAHVGELRTSWVESAPQATLSRSGRTFVWRSGVPVNPSSSVALRFQFAREGTGDRPSTCTVNGTACGL